MHPKGSDYSSWMSTSNYYLGYYEWFAQEIETELPEFELDGYDIAMTKDIYQLCDELAQYKELDPKRPELPRQVVEEVEIMVKYEGYIKMQEKQVEGFKKLEKKLLPDDVDYNTIKGIRLEARQKLNKYKPYSIGQASRISGVSPADISVLLIFLEQYGKTKK